MTVAGWVFLAVCWGVVTGVTVWCYWEILGGGQPKVHDPGGAHRL